MKKIRIALVLAALSPALFALPAIAVIDTCTLTFSGDNRCTVRVAGIVDELTGEGQGTYSFDSILKITAALRNSRIPHLTAVDISIGGGQPLVQHARQAHQHGNQSGAGYVHERAVSPYGGMDNGGFWRPCVSFLSFSLIHFPLSIPCRGEGKSPPPLFSRNRNWLMRQKNACLSVDFVIY
ncbi:MAG: hypothetical protein LBG27_05850 [Spirochaetaceae bacterium]|jgi:hypothetical protein|nr:hypothetical protein [Spirochaetaceae bacterium]